MSIFPVIPQSPKSTALFSHILVISLCILPVIGHFSPRFMAFAPAIIGVAGLIGFHTVYGMWPKFSRPALGWAAGFAILMTVSTLWSIDHGLALERASKTFLVLGGGALLITLIQSVSVDALADFRRFFPLGVLAAGLLCLIELYLKLPVASLFSDTLSDDFRNFSNLNRSVVLFMLFSFAALFGLQFSQQEMTHMQKIMIALLSVVLIGVLYATNSQSAQLAFVVAGVFYLAFPVARTAPWYVLCVIMTFGIFTAPWIAGFLFQTLLPLVLDMRWFQQGYAAPRMEIWNFVAQRALEKPLLGHGVEATRLIKDFETQQRFHNATEVLHPHNFMLQLWIEFGMLGAVFATAFFTDIIMRIRQAGPLAARMYLPVLMGTVSVAATGYGLWQGWWLGTFVMLFVYTMLTVRTVNQKSYFSAAKA